MFIFLKDDIGMSSQLSIVAAFDDLCRNRVVLTQGIETGTQVI